MDPELDSMIELSDTTFEAMFHGLIYYIIKILFKITEVVVEFGEITQKPH